MAVKEGGPTRADWVAAGLSALSAGGIEAVKIERLAASLGISKGPFYWRFKDRSELLQAIIDFWKRDFTTVLVDQTAHLRSPQERLRHLADLSLAHQSDGIDVARAECALRVWAASHSQPREAVREVDTSRIKHVANEFVLIGASSGLAEQLSRAVYIALLGLYTVRQYTPEIADDGAFRLALGTAIETAERAAASSAATYN